MSCFEGSYHVLSTRKLQGSFCLHHDSLWWFDFVAFLHTSFFATHHGPGTFLFYPSGLCFIVCFFWPWNFIITTCAKQRFVSKQSARFQVTVGTNLHSVFSGVSTIGWSNLIPLLSPFLSGMNFHSPPRLNKCSFNSGETWNGEIHPLVRSALLLAALKSYVRNSYHTTLVSPWNWWHPVGNNFRVLMADFSSNGARLWQPESSNGHQHQTVANYCRQDLSTHSINI